MIWKMILVELKKEGIKVIILLELMMMMKEIRNAVNFNFYIVLLLYCFILDCYYKIINY